MRISQSHGVDADSANSLHCAAMRIPCRVHAVSTADSANYVVSMRIPQAYAEKCGFRKVTLCLDADSAIGYVCVDADSAG
jgi:hypothetical protein